ncbi:MAG: hypothetical protein ABEI52_04700 [Halobacteriaceae archaeon]
MGKWQRVLVVMATFSIAVALRAGPLHFSPLPFNPDGIHYAGQATITVTSGSLPIAQMPVDDFAFTAFLALISSLTDVPPRYIAQPAIAVVGAIPVLLVIPVGHRIARDIEGFNLANGGIYASGLIAVDGLYLHRSMAVDEQTLGLLFVPLVAVTIAVAILRGDRRWLVPLGIALLALPPTHNLDSIIAAIALLLLSVFVARTEDNRTLVASLVIFVAFTTYFIAYNFLVAEFTRARIIQEQFITQAPGLFLGWLILGMAGMAWLSRTRASTIRRIGGGIFAFMFFVLGLNAVVPVFPGMQGTPLLMLALLSPLLVPVTIATWGIPLQRNTKWGRPFLAIIGAVITLIGLGLTAALTPDYLNLLYRAQTFLHVPVMLAAGLGIGVLAKSRRARWGIVIVTLIATAAAIPIAFSGLELLSYKGITEPTELSASDFAVHHLPRQWTTDDHLARITGYWINSSMVSRRPILTWASGGPPPNCPTLIQRSWATVGAQMYPRPPIIVTDARIERFQVQNEVVYSGGDHDRITLVISNDGNESNGC